MKTLMPTSMDSAQLATLTADILERSRFSARVQSAEHLDVLDTGINNLIAGKTDIATARLQIKQFLARAGYKPEDGEEGGLKDFSSDERINLQLRMNTQQAQGYGQWKQGQDTVILDAFPAQELYRIGDRKEPRNWPLRWAQAGGRTYGGGRMIALKDDPIWERISAFGIPYPPFDFGSGMGLIDVSRRVAMAFGIIDRDTQIQPQDRPFNEDLQAVPAILSEILKQLLNASGAGHFDTAGVFHCGPVKGGA